jgi:hypothetical protein
MDFPVIYRGYSFVDLTTLVGVGAYKARAAVVVAPREQPQSQRFLDFEVFERRSDAQRRAIEGARAWIDAEVAGQRMPSVSTTVQAEHL